MNATPTLDTKLSPRLLHADPPLPLLGDPQQLAHQPGVRREDELHPALLQDLRGSVGSGHAGQQQGETLRVDLPAAVRRRAVGPAAPIHGGGGGGGGLARVPVAAAALRQLDQELPLVYGLGLNTWRGIKKSIWDFFLLIFPVPVLAQLLDFK